MALLGAVAACGSDDDEPGADGQLEDVGSAVGESIGSTTTTAPPATTTTTAAPVAVRDLTISSAAVPAAAPNGNDACGTATDFQAANLSDGDQETAWRTSGDITGSELTVYLDGQHDVRNVGLVPGYNKVDPCDGTERFFQNRRVLRVTWTFDDGTSVAQDFSEDPSMQAISVAAVTSSVRIRIEAVSADGGKDFTAISEIAIRGA